MIISRSHTRLCAAVLMLALLNGPAAIAQTPAAPAAPFAAAKPGELKIFLSGALRQAVEQTTPQMQAAVGPMMFEVRQARILQPVIEAGAVFDAAMLTRPVIEALAASGKIAPDSLVDLGDVPLGVTARGDVSKIDISTPEALKRTLLGATAIRRNYGLGATAPLIDHVFSQLGVVDAVKDTVNPRAGGQPALPPPVLGPGEYELELSLRSEIRPTPDWTLIGVVPDSLRLPNRMAAGVSANGDRARGERLMTFLRLQTFRDALGQSGVDLR
jgi:molybdate transport system substrate-binding protein